MVVRSQCAVTGVTLCVCACVFVCVYSESPDPYIINSRGNCYNSLGMWKGTPADTHTHTHTHTHMRARTHTHTHTHTRACARALLACYVFLSAHVCTCAHVYVIVFVYLCTCACVCVCVCVCSTRTEAREDYLTSSQLFQQAKGFKGRGGSQTPRLDGAIFAASNAALMLAQLGERDQRQCPSLTCVRHMQCIRMGSHSHPERAPH